MRLPSLMCAALLISSGAFLSGGEADSALEWAASVQKLQPTLDALAVFRTEVAAGRNQIVAWATVLKTAGASGIPTGDETALLRAALGAGRVAAGTAFVNRERTNRMLAAIRQGGSSGSEAAVEAALRWFARHQSSEGKWDPVDFTKSCGDEPKSEPGSLEGHSREEVTTALTGFAVLAFLGAGYDHKTPSPYRDVVKKGIAYLVWSQKPDGLLGARNYEHPIATMALAEALAMTQDPTLRQPTQRAAQTILKRQCWDSASKGREATGLGWDYVNPSKRQDVSVSGWNVQALRSVAATGIRVQGGLDGARTFLERSWRDSNSGKDWCADWSRLDPSKDISRYPYTWNSENGAVELSSWDAAKQKPDLIAEHDLAAVGMVMSAILGHPAGDPMLESLGNYVVRFETPTAYPCNTYHLYYGALGMFQLGGTRWEGWNGTVRDLLVKAQVSEGCAGGSWDWQGTMFHGSAIGRVLSTALNCLSLEVYYRYERVTALRHR